MEQIKKLAENKNFTAINIGRLADVKSYSLIHPKTGKEVKGKVFLKEPTLSSGTEISFTTIPPKTELGYFHLHYKDEETYIILSGAGYYQVDDDCFPIQEGSVIRVAPEGVRSLCNTSDVEMVYICVQSKKDSLEEYTTDDGERVSCEAKWRDL
ncbi:cupin domain-containing protein [Mangrovibacterium diazotrophicum]|uniref:Cupin domain-containing protein n=1 Tax=Mangrovibacterium diazotrophicum TaxID=1261403 RepID=A0A419VVJ2_9BACT|nr:cupin domain-containing protein [Mangrovibacterium diazotrophicum]RKD86177.1 Cupin domain-containing protein [Mangrovibacterium diazotrophicum]